MRRALVLMLVGFSLLLTPSCRWERRHSAGVAIGGIGGAGLGALIGAAAGDWGTGAVIGAAGGALAGYLIADATGPSEGEYPSRREHVTYRDRPPSEAERRQARAREDFDQGMRAKTHAESKYYLQRSLDTYPTPDAYNNLGLLLLNEGDREGAHKMWDKALRLDPEYNPAVQNLARLGT